jgi:hypothetical protein
MTMGDGALTMGLDAHVCMVRRVCLQPVVRPCKAQR